MRLIERLQSLPRLFRERPRRVSASAGLAYIEFQEIGSAQINEFSQRVQQRFSNTAGVKWAEVNAYLRRVVVAYEETSTSLEQLTAAVKEAERLPISRGGVSLDSERELPDDDDLEFQRVVELLAEIAGFWLGLGLKVVPFNPTTLGINAVAILALIQSTPRLRRRLDERYGRDRTDLVINLAISVGQAMSERPMSSAVGIIHKTEVLRELRTRRRVWRERSHRLYDRPAGTLVDDTASEPRPCALPDGPIERYSDRTVWLALSSFGLSFLATRSLSSATAALLGALPRPAKLGRELFATELSRMLSKRGCLVLSPAALRRLDRVDCVVLQGSLIPSERYSLGQTVVRANSDREEMRNQARMLFNPEAPLDVQRKGNWRLGPAALLKASGGEEIERLATELGAKGELVLALANGDEITAIQQIDINPPTGIEEIIRTADESGLRVVVASSDASIGERMGIYDTIPHGLEACSAVRKLQEQGNTVCFIGQADSLGLPAADVAVGLTRTDQPPPWGAHIVCKESLSDVRVLMRACAEARLVSRQSVQLAMGAAIVSTLVSGGGILRSPSRRVMFVVNAANLLAIFNGVRRAFILGREEWPQARDPIPWHALEGEGVLKRLNSSRYGLTNLAAQKRVSLIRPSSSALSEFARAVYAEMDNPLTPLLVAGAGLSALVGSIADAVMVGGAFGITATVGGVQRFRTEGAIRQLLQTAQQPVRAYRDGVLRELRPKDGPLVPGDIIALNAGDEIPADCRILESHGLEVDASSLTGESLPIKKKAAPSFNEALTDRSCMLYAGTAIAAGDATAVVVAVGAQTEAHRVVYPKNPVNPTGGVETRLRALMHLTGPVAIAAGFGLMSAGLLRGRKLEELVDTGVSLAVAAVPEGLPILATAAQLSAARRLSRHGAMVRNPRCVEALGRLDIICLDKTGTVTEGRLELQAISDGVSEFALEEIPTSVVRVLEVALRATGRNRLSENRADPIDRALERGAIAAGVNTQEIGSEQRLSELPFEAARGFHSTFSQARFGKVLSIKGAPELILERCSHWRPNARTELIDEAARNRLRSEADRLARIGLRVIAVAERKLEPDEEKPAIDKFAQYTLLGLLLFRDRIRPSAKASLDELHRAGIRIIMLTGDHPRTAATIANELGLVSAGALITGGELATMSDEALAFRLPTTSVFARVTPSQKVRIVRALQRAGHVVAMAGDGANDAPPIRAADVGLAIGEHSTPAARAAADIVLSDARIENVLEAIIEGRAMWVSVRNAVSILVGGNLGEIGFSLGAGLFSGRPPLSPRQLLLVNFLTDIAPAIAIAVRPPLNTDAASLVHEGPEASLGKPLNREIALRAAITALGAGGGWFVGRVTGTRSRASTIGLVSLVCTQLGQTLTSGGLSAPVLLTSVGSTAALFSIIQTPGLSHLFGCRPLGPLAWTTAFGSSAAATAASVLVPNIAEWVALRIRELSVDLGVPPEVLQRGIEVWRRLEAIDSRQRLRYRLPSRFGQQQMSDI
ncbi:MAG: cation-translocating P-type ATPase [Deltaproteobacteria bacterium]|nr:cation-translocating P-type ATPase [Deltaproteobacteria bacterium]